MPTFILDFRSEVKVPEVRLYDKMTLTLILITHTYIYTSYHTHHTSSYIHTYIIHHTSYSYIHTRMNKFHFDNFSLVYHVDLPRHGGKLHRSKLYLQRAHKGLVFHITIKRIVKFLLNMRNINFYCCGLF